MVVVYEGQSQRLNAATVAAAQLAAADVVLTTYEVLRRDLNHEPGEVGAQRSLRYGKKYEVFQWLRSHALLVAGTADAVHRMLHHGHSMRVQPLAWSTLKHHDTARLHVL